MGAHKAPPPPKGPQKPTIKNKLFFHSFKPSPLFGRERHIRKKGRPECGGGGKIWEGPVTLKKQATQTTKQTLCANQEGIRLRISVY